MPSFDGGITRRDLIKGTVAAGSLALVGSPGVAGAQQSGPVGNKATSVESHGDLAGRLRGGLITDRIVSLGQDIVLLRGAP